MKAADPRLLDALNDILTSELTAVNQYFAHAKLCGHWGFKKLHDFIRKESIDEMKHSEMLMERILYLDGFPNLQRLFKVNVGENVEEQFALDLQVEYEAVGRLNTAIALCVAVGDNGTRELLERILVSEEEHIDWLETQQETIKQIGIANYLSQQLG